MDIAVLIFGVVGVTLVTLVLTTIVTFRRHRKYNPSNRVRPVEVHRWVFDQYEKRNIRNIDLANGRLLAWGVSYEELRGFPVGIVERPDGVVIVEPANLIKFTDRGEAK